VYSSSMTEPLSTAGERDDALANVRVHRRVRETRWHDVADLFFRGDVRLAICVDGTCGLERELLALRVEWDVDVGELLFAALGLEQLD